MAAGAAGAIGLKRMRLTVPKRTSQGIDHKPKGKHKRKRWKAYRGQGRP